MRCRPLLVGLVLAMVTSVWLSAAAVAAPPTGNYIVVLDGNAAAPAAVATRHRKQFGVKVHSVYRRVLKGYSARIRGSELAALKRDRSVAYIERDHRVSVAKPRAKGKPGGAAPTYSFASWGIDRIDQRNLPLSSSYDVVGNGAGVKVYVLDTGIRMGHTEFGNPSRASSGLDVIDGGSADDCHGHGTHVAGTIAGSTYGVAKAAHVVAVRVLDCTGSGNDSGVIAGLDFVAGESGLRVANLSIGGPASQALDAAIADLVEDGVTVVVAAGNEQRNACLGSPARAETAITVAATTSTDDRASYSNYGSCVDLFAPGSSIRSAWHTTNTATATLSGTSMASPHVAGVAALIVGANQGMSPSEVYTRIDADATPGKVKGLSKPRFSGTPNLLLYKE